MVLPEHLYYIWTLLQNDADVRTHLALIKTDFSRTVPGGKRRSESRPSGVSEGH